MCPATVLSGVVYISPQLWGKRERIEEREAETGMGEGERVEEREAGMGMGEGDSRRINLSNTLLTLHIPWRDPHIGGLGWHVGLG